MRPVGARSYLMHMRRTQRNYRFVSLGPGAAHLTVKFNSSFSSKHIINCFNCMTDNSINVNRCPIRVLKYFFFNIFLSDIPAACVVGTWWHFSTFKIRQKYFDVLIAINYGKAIVVGRKSGLFHKFQFRRQIA